MATVALPEPTVVVLVGAAGSGKSSIAARSFAGEEILSSDAYRRRVSGDAADQAATGRAFLLLHRALESRLGARQTSVIDATNTTARARGAIIARRDRVAPEVPVVAVVLDLPADVVIARNAGRAGRAVPERTVRAQLADIRRTVDGRELEAEGFAAIIVVSSTSDLDELVLRRPSRR